MINRRFFILPLLFLVNIALWAQATLGLEEAKAKAIASNVKITNSQLEIDAAIMARDKAATLYYPSVSFDGVAMHAIDPLLEISTPGGNLPVYDGNPANLATATQFAYTPASTIGLLQKVGLASLVATQPVYTGGKIKTGNEMAEIGVGIREEQKVLSQKELLLTTEQQYWQIVALQEKQHTIDGYRELLDQLYLQVNDAYEAGLIIRNDVYKVELEQSQLAPNESKLQNGRALALMQFAHTIGEDYEASLLLEDELDDFQAPAFYRQSDSTYLSSLSEIKLLDKSVELQKLQSEMIAADYKPTIAVGVNAFYLTQFEEDASSFNALGFASVSIPISHHWMGDHDLQEQRLKTQIAANTLADTKRLLELRTAKSWVDLNEAYEQIQIMQQRIAQASENFRVSQTSYDNGIVTLSDLLEAKALQIEAQDELTEAKVKYKVAIASYLLHSGKK